MTAPIIFCSLTQHRCVDYIRVIRDRYGFTESCGGDDPGDNQNQLEQGVM